MRCGMELELYFDGACQNNGSPDAVGGIGWWIGDDRSIIAEGFDYLEASTPPVTNNVAEWKALIAALRWVACLKGPTSVSVYGDSNLVIMQFNLAWKAKSVTLAALRDEALAIVATMRAKPVAKWIPREENTIADELSNRGINK